MQGFIPPRQVTVELGLATDNVSLGGDLERPLCVAEWIALLDELAEMQVPLLRVVLSEPELSSSQLRILQYASARRLRPVLVPDAMAGLSKEAIDEVAICHPEAIEIPVDDVWRPGHDESRGSGSWRASLETVERMSRHGLAVQASSRVRSSNVDRLDELLERILELGAGVWTHAVRARVDDPLGLRPDQMENLFAWIARTASLSRVELILNEVPQFRRFLLERLADPTVAAPRPQLGRVRLIDSRQTVCLSDCGGILPSRDLPLVAGHVRKDLVASVYRYGAVFRRLRDREELEGRCGRCKMNEVCGGSRARAWKATGDPLAEDPACLWPDRETLTRISHQVS